MAFGTIKKVALVLVVLWIGTLCYLWFPNLLPDLVKSKLPNKLSLESDHHHGNIKFRHVAAKLNESKEVIHICITSDEHTIGGMIALINSIISNTKSDVMFHLVTDETSMDQLGIWIQKSKLSTINYEIKKFPGNWVEGKINVRGGRKELGRPLNYARYYLPKLFPTLNGKIIFIDDDCIVQGDISELYQTKVNPGHLAAFSEDCTGAAKRLTYMKNIYADYIDVKSKHVQLMKIDPQECAFNTGLFLTNITEWRIHNITQQLEYWMQLNTKEEVYGNERGGGGSQPPMMLVFYKKFSKIPAMWHVRYLGWTPGTSYTTQFLRSAKLLHWNGRFKPWGRTSQHSEIWDKYFIADPSHRFHPVRKAIV
ncbi:hypothetical protein SNE40_014036 [Patella caerulea]